MSSLVHEISLEYNKPFPYNGVFFLLCYAVYAFVKILYSITQQEEKPNTHALRGDHTLITEATITEA
jgi:hypothetical protein